MTGLVISFDEVRRRNEIKTDTEAEKRISEKEATYQGLIAREAKRLGKPFDEMKAIIVAADKENEERLQQEGLGYKSYENKLDRQIRSLRYFVEEFAPLIPQGVQIGW